MFADELLEAARRDMRQNAFVAALIDGRSSHHALRRYAAGLFALSDRLPQRLLAIAARCEDRGVRLALLENLLDEEGIVGIDGGRLMVDEGRRHPNMARRFAHAAGVSDADLSAASASAMGEATWLNDAIAQNHLTAALAYLTIGIESNVPSTMTLVAAALERHYGFDRGDLEFLTAHIELDEGHAANGARLTSRLVRNDADRAEALEGARRGGLAWWWWHRSFA